MLNTKYTDETYIPLNQLMHLAPNDMDEIERYRDNFKDLLSISPAKFSFLIETPSLIKKRYQKNVELASKITNQVQDNDYIKWIAKQIVNNKSIPFSLPHDELEIIKLEFEKNANDLTIVTTYLIDNISQYLFGVELSIVNNMDVTIPELSKRDVAFLKNCNNIKDSYSIQHYQDVNSCSYETSRSGMERLAEIGLFIKKKISKKFVYQPTSKLAKLIERGGDE